MSQFALTVIDQLAQTLAREGICGAFVRAGADPATGINVRFLMRHPGVRDEAIVNTYGTGAQIITLAHLPPFTTDPPARFDYLLEGGEFRYVFDSFVRRAVGDTTVAWTVYCKGLGV
jgi:hypothetical protein